jgi:hypothetical protein
MDKKMKKYIPLFVIGGLALLAVGIYIVVNRIGMATRIGYPAEPANFWVGLWQGLIICLSFIASWFDKNIVLYQVHNNGFWYNFGFMIGLCIAIGSSANGQKAKSNKKKAKNTPICE